MKPPTEQGAVQEAWRTSGRKKLALEPPMVPRIEGEGYRIVFAPPRWYDGLIRACLFGGPALILASNLDALSLRFGVVSAMTGLMVFGAGVWGLVSHERMICRLRDRTYERWEGVGWSRKKIRGSLDELDAIVLLAEGHSLGASLMGPVRAAAQAGSTGFAATSVTYRLTIFWKGMRCPPLVIYRLDRALGANEPLHARNQEVLPLGAELANHLGVRYYDNSYFSSPEPVRAW